MIQLIILCGLFYCFRNSFAETTQRDAEDFLVMDMIADGEFDGDLD